MTMKKIKLLIASKSKDRERAVLPTILFCSQSEDWGDVKGNGYALMLGWWKWGIGFSYVKATPTQLSNLGGDDE